MSLVPKRQPAAHPGQTAIYKVILSCDPTAISFSKSHVLKLDLNDLVCVEYEGDDDWAIGYKLVFGLRKNMSIYANDVFKEEGYVPREHLKRANLLSDLEVYSWYLECDKKLALVIMDRIFLLTNSEAPYFMVRFRKDAGHAITVCFEGKVKHIRINSVARLKSVEYTIDNSLYFASIVELIDYYMQNSLVEYFKDIDTSLGMPYREMLPEPVFRVVSPSEYAPEGDYLESRNQEIWLRRGCAYFYLQEFEHWSYVFNADGLLGYVPKKLLIA